MYVMDRIEAAERAVLAGIFRAHPAVREGQKSLFLVDCTRITGHPGETTAVVIDSLLGPQAVTVPTEASLLVLKLEAVLFRRFLKPADVFDVWFLRSRAVRLEDLHRERLSEQVRLREIERGEVEQRLGKLAPARLLADVQRRMSPEAAHAWTPAQAQAALGETLAVLRDEIRWP